MCAAVSALAFAYAQHHPNDEPADIHHDVEAASDPTEQLSPKLRALPNREMALIDEGMGDLATAISLGEWKRVGK